MIADRKLVTTQWITGRSFDLLWYLGACVTGYVLLFLNVSLKIPALLLFWFWILSVDGPHIFGTISRTYLDAAEWKSRGLLLLGSLLWFLPGPIAVLSGVITGDRLPFLLFLIFAQLWAYWHVVRQHYGFLTLYQRKNGEPSGVSNKIDYWFFYIAMLAPFMSFLLRHPDARKEIGLGATTTSIEQIAVIGLHAIIAGAVLVYVIKECLRLKRKEPLNLPKNLFLVACVPLHLTVFLHPAVSTKVDLRLFAVFVTFYHNIQYHGIVWFYNQNRYHNDPAGEHYGLASHINRNFLTYYAAGLLFTLSYRYINWCLTGLMVPFGCGPNAVSEFRLGGVFKLSDLAIGFWWGVAFNHYYLDQKIWRVSRDRELRQNLSMEQT